MTNDSTENSSSRERIVAAANDEFLLEGTMPISLAEVARRADVSRSLIYAHFPSQTDLMNAVLEHHVNQAVGILDYIDAAKPLDTAINVAISYFDHLVAYGPVLANAPRDSFLQEQISNEYRSFVRTMTRKLARMAMVRFELGAREAIASTIMLRAFPEEAAAVVRNGQADIEIARSELANLTRTAILALQTDKISAA